MSVRSYFKRCSLFPCCLEFFFQFKVINQLFILINFFKLLLQNFYINKTDSKANKLKTLMKYLSITADTLAMWIHIIENSISEFVKALFVHYKFRTTYYKQYWFLLHIIVVYTSIIWYPIRNTIFSAVWWMLHEYKLNFQYVYNRLKLFQRLSKQCKGFISIYQA